MPRMRTLITWFSTVIFGVFVSASCFAQSPAARVTIIYDSFGAPSSLERGWGYAALVEYRGKRILFDTGGQYQAFVSNVKTLGIDLTKLDFVVLSHRHGDHTSGLAYVLQQNPKVKIYAPEETGSFGTPTRGATVKGINRKVENVPADLHYFDGKHADSYPIDSPWPSANISLINKVTEVLPGFYLFRTISEEKGTMELNEISMAVDTPRGLAVFVGCSHPGIEKILAVATTINPKLYTVIGGLHLLDKPDPMVTQIVENFKNKWKTERVGAGHCSGEFTQTELQRVFGQQHDHSGIGEKLELPQ